MNLLRLFASKKPTETRSIGPNVYEGYVGNWPVEDWHALVDKKGRAIYAEMYERDDMVRSSVMTLQLAALHKGYSVTPAVFDPVEGQETPEEEAARFAADAWDAMQGSPIENLRTLLSPMYMGFCAIEPVWTDVLTDGEWAGKRRYARLKPLPVEWVKFRMDAHGDITGMVQETQGTASGQYIEFEPGDLIYWAHDAGDGNPYGRSLLDPAFPAYFGKLEAEKSWVRYCERFGTPIPWGRYPEDAGEGYKTTLLTVLKSIRTAATFAVPSNWDVQLWQAQHSEQVAFFTEFFAHADRRIARSIGIPSLVNENSETGAYSLGQAHLTTMGQRIIYYQRTLEDVIQEQWLEPLHRENYPPTVGCPRFHMNPFAEDDLKFLADIAQVLTGMGLPLAQADLYDKFPFRRPEEGEDTLEKKAAPMPFLPAPEPEEEPEEGEPEEEDEEKKELPPEMIENQFAIADPIERFANFAATNAEEDLALKVWGEVAGIVLEDAAEKVASSGSPGARPTR